MTEVIAFLGVSSRPSKAQRESARTRFPPRPVATDWPATRQERGEAWEQVTSGMFVLGNPDSQERRVRGLAWLLDWLADQPGETWQQRWMASGADPAGGAWRQVPIGWQRSRGRESRWLTRLGALGLELHPEKTKVVFCQDANRSGGAEHTSFDFLGYTFRGRLAKGRRGYFVSFAPAISGTARKAIGQKVRAWHLNRRSGTDLSGLAEEIDPQVRGWIGYYGAFYRSELYSLARHINEHLVRWAMQKFKRLRGSAAKAWAWLDAVRQHQPRLFAHWHLLPPTRGRPAGAV